MTEHENEEIYQAQVKDYFETQKAKRHPPPEEKIDPVKAKRTLDALQRPPPSPPQTNYERITEKVYLEAERSGSTVSDRRLAERRAGKQIAQLGEQAKQSCPPRSRCLATSSLMIRGWCPVIAILEITCPTMYIMKSWRWTNTNTIREASRQRWKISNNDDAKITWLVHENLQRVWGEEYFDAES